MALIALSSELTAAFSSHAMASGTGWAAAYASEELCQVVNCLVARALWEGRPASSIRCVEHSRL